MRTVTQSNRNQQIQKDRPNNSVISDAARLNTARATIVPSVIAMISHAAAK